jgi:hypothetical protein
MKIIQLTPQEFYIFKIVAKFEYKIQSIKHTIVSIEADKKDLEVLGY